MDPEGQEGESDTVGDTDGEYSKRHGEPIPQEHDTPPIQQDKKEGEGDNPHESNKFFQFTYSNHKT